MRDLLAALLAVEYFAKEYKRKAEEAEKEYLAAKKRIRRMH